MMNPIDINSSMFTLQGKNIDDLQEKSKISSRGTDDEKLRKSAESFESVFLAKFLDIMDSTVEKSDFLHGGEAEKTFKSMLNQQIALDISSNPATSIGFAEQVYKQMKEKM